MEQQFFRNNQRIFTIKNILSTYLYYFNFVTISQILNLITNLFLLQCPKVDPVPDFDFNKVND